MSHEPGRELVWFDRPASKFFVLLMFAAVAGAAIGGRVVLHDRIDAVEVRMDSLVAALEATGAES